jgi:3'-phosphoadenosine 5'-phosphosulfate sulfotransferase
MDSLVVLAQLTKKSKVRAERLKDLHAQVEHQRARFPGGVTFVRIPRERNGVADRLARDAAEVSKSWTS